MSIRDQPLRHWLELNHNGIADRIQHISVNVQVGLICVKWVLRSALEQWRMEGNILFNDALNTFYLRLYGVRHMVKDHSESERGNPLPPHELLLPISSKGYFICIIPQTIQDNTYHDLCYTSRGAQWVHLEDSTQRPIAPWANTFTTELHLAPLSNDALRYSKSSTNAPWCTAISIILSAKTCLITDSLYLNTQRLPGTHAFVMGAHHQITSHRRP